MEGWEGMGEASGASQQPLRSQLCCWQLSDFFPTELNPTSAPIRRCYGNVDGRGWMPDGGELDVADKAQLMGPLRPEF